MDRSVANKSKQLSTRNLERCAGGPAEVIREDRRNRAADIIRLAYPAQRDTLRDEGIGRFIVSHGPTAEVGSDRARRDGVHPDSSRSEFHGHEAGQDIESPLHRSIDAEAGRGESDEPGRHIQNASPILDYRQELLCQEHWRAQMHRDKRVELLFGRFREVGAYADACVVDQVVEPFASKSVM